MSSLTATPTRHQCTPPRRANIRANNAIDFCLVSPAPKGLHGKGDFPFSPGVEIHTPPTPDTVG